MALYKIVGSDTIQTINGSLVASKYDIQQLIGTSWVNVNANDLSNKGCKVIWSIDSIIQGMFFCTNWNNSLNSCQGFSSLSQHNPYRIIGIPGNIYTSMWIVSPEVSFLTRIQLFVHIEECRNSSDNQNSSNGTMLTLIDSSGRWNPFISVLPPIVGSTGEYDPSFPERCRFEIIGPDVIECGGTAYFYSSNFNPNSNEHYIYTISNNFWRLTTLMNGMIASVRAPSLMTALRYPFSREAYLCITRHVSNCDPYVRCKLLRVSCDIGAYKGHKYRGIIVKHDIFRQSPFTKK